MNVVFVGASASVFVTRTQAELQKRGVSVSIVDPSAESSPSTGGYGIAKRLSGLVTRYRTVRRQISGYPTDSVVMVHFLSIDCVWLVPLLKSRFSRVIGIAYGSDVLRRQRSRDPILEYGLKRLDAVVATNTNVLEALLLAFPTLANRSAGIVRFGLPVFDALLKLYDVPSRQAKAALGFDPSKRLVSLGYSASPGQRQIELIDFFSPRLATLEDLDFVIPVQYGSPETVSAVISRCIAVNSHTDTPRFRPLTEFHSPDQAALMRRATDVLINHSVTDAFSGTVQEVVYAGNLVFAARHLPYERMPGYQTAILPYAELDEVALSLRREDLAAHLEKASAAAELNRAALQATSSWEAVFPDWQKLLGLGPE